MKMNEYPIITEVTATDITLFDGTNGTRKIQASELMFALAHLGGAAMHRMLFRGKNLGASVSTEQLAAIQNGTFKELWLGDYWEINGVKYRIADFDYWYGRGDTKFNDHHLVIVPDTALGSAAMNASSVTTGGYTGSQMYTANMATAKSTIQSAFSTAIKTHREFLVNTVANGYPSAGAWTDSQIELMNEPMVYGSYIYTPGNTGTTDVKRFTIDNTQLALFTVCPWLVPSGTGYWLRDVVSAGHFARVDGSGGSTSSGAANSYGIRPVFAIG